MKLSLLVAMDENQAIGLNNQLPWRIPADLAFFKRTTMGKPILMGRKTFDSLGRPLKGRENLVLSRNPAWQAPDGVKVFSDLESALDYLRAGTYEEVFIIGGAQIFEKTLPIADRLRITQVKTQVPKADTYFPSFSRDEWERVDVQAFSKDEDNPFDYCFEIYERRSS